MPSQRIKLRRGTTAQQQNFTGAEGEVTFDTDKNTLIVHDGTTKGGHVLPRDTDVKTDIDQLTDVYGILESYVGGFSGTTETYTITVAAASSGGGNVFYITGLENPHIVLTPGNRYIFDVSDSSNTGHPLYFTADDGTTNYTTGVSRIGTEGTAGAKVIFIIPADVPALKYYCSVHGLSMGNQISSVLNTPSSGGSSSLASFDISPALPTGETSWNLATDGDLSITEAGNWTFTATGDGTVDLSMKGAGGGYGKDTNALGGAGGETTGKISVTSGDTFIVTVGSKGVQSGGAGAYGGGGAGGNLTLPGSGGGYSGIFEGAEQQSKSILIAGGGGGGHGWDAGSATGNGGSGGGAEGTAGTAGSSGGGATQTGGGAGAGNGTGGTPLTGGTGGTRSTNQGSGGGGGGGYFGGGGGAAGSYNGNQNGTPGGGGSGYIGGTSNFAVTDGVTTAGAGSTTEVDGTFSMVGQVATTEETTGPTVTTYNLLSGSSKTGLLITTDGEAGVNSSFTDSSSNSATITASGTPQLNTFSPYRHGGYSTHFDGTGDYLSTPSAEGFKFGTGDFTIEGWINFNISNTTKWHTPIDCWQGTNNYNWLLNLKSDTFAVALGNNGAYSASHTHQVTISPALSAGNWYHFAVTRESGSLRHFINGIQQGSTISSGANISDNIPVAIGTNQDGGGNELDGYLSDIRVVKGTALYTADFTPPTERLTAIDGTQLLTCHLPYIVDGSSNSATITLNGDVHTEPLSPYDHIGYIEGTHGGSVYFDGSGDYMSLPANDEYNFGSGDFTIEAWVYVDIAAIAIPIVGWDNGSYKIIRLTSSGINVESNSPSNISFTAGFTEQPVSNVWNHIAIVRSGNSFTAYLNGKGGTPYTYSGNVGNGTDQLNIGYKSDPTYYNGWMADLRITKGTAVYTTDFTPTTAPLESTNSALHIKGVEGHIIDKAQSGNNLTLVGNTVASIAESKYAGSSIYFDGTGDYITTDAINIGTGAFTFECWINPNSINSIDGIYGTSGGSGSNPKFVVHLNNGTPSIHYNGLTNANDIYTAATSSINASEWTHIAFVRESNGNWTWYINGTASGTGTNSTDITFTTQPTYIGYGGEGYFTEFSGYIEDLRLTQGVAVYTADFTVPNAALEAPQVVQSEGSYTVATGGTITTDGNYKYHTFTEDGTFSITSVGTNTTIDVLAVGGGGGGGGSADSNSGGGGAGGYLEGSITAEVQSYDIVIGQGGAGGVGDVGASGGDTTISVLNATAIGGGYGGGGARSQQTAGAQGGSGGGGGGFPNDMAGGAGIQGDSGGLTGYGNAGGSAGSYAADGGGGAGSAGGPDGNPRAGGTGRQWLDGNFYAGGGGAASDGPGGSGVGGTGANGDNDGGHALPNTGGGGAGSYAAGSGSSSTGGNGGSGVVIFRYPYQGTVTETAPTSTSYRYMKVVLNSVSSGTQAQVTEISFTGENGATDFITGQTITNWYGTGSTATSQSPTIALVNNAQSPQNSEHTNLDTLPFTLEYDLGASYIHGTQLRYLQLGSSDSAYRYPTSVTVYGATQPDFSDEVALITNSVQAYASVNSNTLIDLGTSITGGSAGSATFSDLLAVTGHPINVYDDTREQRETTNAFSGTHSLYINFAGSTRRSPQDTSGYTYTDYTISFWARMESWNTYNGTRINWLTNGPKYQEGNSHGDGAIYVVDNSNEVGFVTQRYNGSLYHYISGTASSSFATDAWYHFVVTGDATNNTATLTVSSDGGTFGDMINASTFTTGNQVATLTPQNLYLAGSSGNAANGAHQIRYDLYGIWDRVLDATERQAVFDAGATHDHPNLPTSGLKLYYTFDNDYNNYSNS